MNVGSRAVARVQILAPSLDNGVALAKLLSRLVPYFPCL